MSSHSIGAALVAAMSVLLLTRAASGSWDWERARAYQKFGNRVVEMKHLKSVIAAWPERSRLIADVIVQEYGVPDEINDSRLDWSSARPWKKVVVFRDAAAAERPGVLLEVLAYGLSDDQRRALAGFERGVEYDPIRRELGACSDDEGTNFLAVNLADEVLQGRRTAAQARELYDRTLSLSYSGKASPAMRGLQFRPADRRAR